MDVVERLVKHLKVHKLKVPAVAESTGIEAARIHKWIQGKANPKHEDTLKLELYLKGNLEEVPRGTRQRHLGKLPGDHNITLQDHLNLMKEHAEMAKQHASIMSRIIEAKLLKEVEVSSVEPQTSVQHTPAMQGEHTFQVLPFDGKSKVPDPPTEQGKIPEVDK